MIELMSSAKVLATLDTKKREVTFWDKKENTITISLTSLLQVTSNVLAEALRNTPEEPVILNNGIVCTQEEITNLSRG